MCAPWTFVGGLVADSLLPALRCVADGFDLSAAHDLEGMAATDQLSHGVERHDLATVAHGWAVLQLFVQAVLVDELVFLAYLVRADADDLTRAASQVDQTLVAEHDLHFRLVDHPLIALLALLVERDQVGVTQRGVGLQAEL
ncbi:hypothetical protein D9M71_687100 [compost metagenome]